MPFWIEGWLEVRRVNEATWSGVLKIDPLVDIGDEIGERLFGLSKRWRSNQSQLGAFAANRGIPPNPSEELDAELARHAQHDREFGSGDLGGHTHATLSELVNISLDPALLAQSEWKLVLDLAMRLAADERFTHDGVRFVVWFNW